MNIYVNGDSFPAGAELADVDLPGWPGYKTVATHNISDLLEEHKTWTENKWPVARQYFGNDANYITAGKELAWPAELTKIDPSIISKNGSKAGASMTGIAHRTVADLIEYNSQGIYFDHVFITLTNCHRFEMYDSTEPLYKFIVDKPLAWLHTFPTETQQNLAKSYIAQYKSEDYSIKFLYTLCSLIYSIKGLTGKYPIILSSLKIFTDNVMIPLNNNDSTVIQTLIKDSGILNLDPEYCMETVHKKHKFLYMPTSHFEQRTHQEYAKIIYNKYLK